ncbi:MAG: NAD(P)H-dependent oxidoreductase [Candidatus Riflebacteria bacterium]|nr:NAD(P)H-dependent oxidoreductase [Candidatus Riflebacteria bacterium]
MNRILHLIASPRGESSRTLALSKVLITRMLDKFPSAILDEFNVFSEHLPEMAHDTISGKYLLMGGKKLPTELQRFWKEVEAHINRFLAADTIVLSVPMWNFGIPYKLKHYLDVIVQPRYLFKYSEKGVEGLAVNKKLFIVSTRGGDYSENSPVRGMDFVEPYLKAVFGFIGISNFEIINAQPLDSAGEEGMKKNFDIGLEKIKKVAI